MDLWRISNYDDLSGVGGLKAPGRWHSKGNPVVYFGENPSLCMLETLVHLDLRADEIPENYQLLHVAVEDFVSVASLDPEGLPFEWEFNYWLTRAIGDEFLREKSAALLKVPSVLVPDQFNYIFNPLHEHAQGVSIISVKAHPYDKRLVSR